MSRLAILNFVFLQWFLIRLCKCTDHDQETYWAILGFVVPLTGWWQNYMWIWRWGRNGIVWPRTRGK